MANMIRQGYTPTHPGEVLKDEIEYRKISQKQLAEQMGISYKILNDILNGRRVLTTATAMMFEAALDVPADSLMRLQLKYNMYVASKDKTLIERLAQICKYAALLYATSLLFLSLLPTASASSRGSGDDSFILTDVSSW